ncbi:MAG: host-nuclease inhibitor Gam family protein [Gammaproteobacteria bacterium]|nr:host-nuclease inhibitor Gam family protein [Gammaproteobacteria bacterium]
MSKVTRIKTEAVQSRVPQSREEAVDAIAEIGRRQRERARIQTIMNDELAAIRQKYEEEARPHADAISALTEGVHTWCEANRDTLTQGGKVKTANLASGEVRWRMRPPSVSARGLDKVLQALKDLQLLRFIRIKEELDKEAVLAEPEAVQHIKGISIQQKEDFVIVPFETELEEVA